MSLILAKYFPLLVQNFTPQPACWNPFSPSLTYRKINYITFDRTWDKAHQLGSDTLAVHLTIATLLYLDSMQHIWRRLTDGQIQISPPYLKIRARLGSENLIVKQLNKFY